MKNMQENMIWKREGLQVRLKMPKLMVYKKNNSSNENENTFQLTEKEIEELENENNFSVNKVFDELEDMTDGYEENILSKENIERAVREFKNTNFNKAYNKLPKFDQFREEFNEMYGEGSWNKILKMAKNK